MSGRLWWLALASIAAALLIEAVLGDTWLATGAAFAATGVTILALIVDEPPRDRRRPW